MHLIYEALKKTNGDTDGDTLIAAMKAWRGRAGASGGETMSRFATLQRGGHGLRHSVSKT
jgi:hypothetical protein